MAVVKSESSKDRPSGWLRPISVLLVVMSAVVLLLHAWRWARGLGHWYDALPGLAFLTLALTNLLEGTTKHVMQFISLVMLIAATAMLIARL